MLAPPVAAGSLCSGAFLLWIMGNCIRSYLQATLRCAPPDSDITQRSVLVGRGSAGGTGDRWLFFFCLFNLWIFFSALASSIAALSCFGLAWRMSVGLLSLRSASVSVSGLLCIRACLCCSCVSSTHICMCVCVCVCVCVACFYSCIPTYLGKWSAFMQRFL